MKDTLSFTFEKKDYTSKTFDFKAFCMIDEMLQGGVHGVLTACAGAVEYLYSGTDGAAKLDRIEMRERANLSAACWDIYKDKLNAKNA